MTTSVGYIAATIPAKVIHTSAHNTLFHIAMLQTGDPLQWVAISQLNNVIDPWIQGNIDILIPPVFPSKPLLILPEISGLPAPHSIPIILTTAKIKPPPPPPPPPPPVLLAGPYNQIDWPNPRGRNPLGGGFIAASETWMLNSLIPFSPHDMPNPRGRFPIVAVQLEYAVSPYLWQINTSSAFPLQPHDLPNPRGRPPLAGDQLGYIIRSNLNMLIGAAPFKPYDMSNPVRRTSPTVQFGYIIKSNLATTFNASPFRQMIWDNPTRNKWPFTENLDFIRIQVGVGIFIDDVSVTNFIDDLGIIDFISDP